MQPSNASNETSLLAGPRPVPALLASLGIHAVILAAMGTVDFDERAPRRLPRPTIVWLGELAPVAPPAERRATERLPVTPFEPIEPDSESRPADELEPDSGRGDELGADESSDAVRGARSSLRETEETVLDTVRSADAASPPETATEPDDPVARLARIVRETERAHTETAAARGREAGYLTFSAADVLPEEPLEEPGPDKSVFDSASVGRAGMAYRTVLGQTVVWGSDNCMTTFGMGNMFGFPTGEDIYNMGVTHCSRQPRDDLFEHIKPAYLIAKPPGPELPIDGTVLQGLSP